MVALAPPPSETIRALFVEDDERLARLTSAYLGSHGIEVRHALDGGSGLEEALRRPYDVVLLDLMLPVLSGMEVCRAVRQHCDVPIIVVTARGDEPDRVMGLEIGADDYVTKPFSARELLARIRAVVRRARGRAGPRERTIQIGELRLDMGSLTATLGERNLELTPHEFRLLRALAEQPGRALSREQILDLATGSADQVFDRAVDVHISRIRHKMASHDKHSAYIKTVRGVGYMLMTSSVGPRG